MSREMNGACSRNSSNPSPEQEQQPNGGAETVRPETRSDWDSAADSDTKVTPGCSGNSKNGASRPPSVRRKLRTLGFGRPHKAKSAGAGNSSGSDKEPNGGHKKHKGPWHFKFNCRLKRTLPSSALSSSLPEARSTYSSCICTGYRRTDESHFGSEYSLPSSSKGKGSTTTTDDDEDRRNVPTSAVGPYSSVTLANRSAPSEPHFAGSFALRGFPWFDWSRFNPDDYPTDDWEERARSERAREIEEGIDPPPGFQSSGAINVLYATDLPISGLASALQTRLALSVVAATANPYGPRATVVALDPIHHSLRPMFNSSSPMTASNAPHLLVSDSPILDGFPHTVHTQVDYIHCLVPDLLQITNCGFYWGKMDRYAAEKLLEGKPEGTFLLRDSAQEEYLFSVSFRRYGRSLHARIEQWNHKFSFDSHDPGVFASPTVCGLIEHYKDPNCCMFFEPLLTHPLPRSFPFSLQHLCRATISSCVTYDSINHLRLPTSVKHYLKEYHYKQRVRVRRFEVDAD